MKLLSVITLADAEVDSGSLDDLDAGGPDTVAGSHLCVHLLNRTIEGGVTVLLVHVVVSSPALVTQPDTKVLDCGGVLLKNLVEGEDLAVALLNLLQLSEEVPELGLGSDLVGCPELHAVNLGLLIGRRRQAPPDHLVLVEPERDHLCRSCRNRCAWIAAARCSEMVGAAAGKV